MTTPSKIHPSVTVATDLIITGPWREPKLAAKLTKLDMILLWPDFRAVHANAVPANATVFLAPWRTPAFADTVTWPT